ncbi:MAG: methionyl-tRNA formyltransferase [Prevotellaceae bacterium]|nr:methionyl-tRNA formyltransferase [Prevotellaceae bacterium]
MGTPEFSAHSLQALIDKKYQVVGVVTTPDKPAGRGLSTQASAVKGTAIRYQLPLLQPEKLRDEQFLEELKSWNADIFVVVAFRMLPEAVWRMPRYGAFNLHASLLPQYRGAAPINWAIINGETSTGLTTFFLDENIDTGQIIFNETIAIAPEENAGQLHDRLMYAGATLVCKTIDTIAAGNLQTVQQPQLSSLKPAPKIHKDTCRINWNDNAQAIYNLIRGLSPYPAAFSELKTIDGNTIPTKIYAASYTLTSHELHTGTIVSDNKTFLKVACSDGFIALQELQLAGKKRVAIKDFLLGFREITNCSFIN